MDPILGSASLSAPSTPEQVRDLSPATCADIGAFKALLKDYRALDDGIVIRLNRSHALSKQRDAQAYARFSRTECELFWTELIDKWRGRERALRYCVAVTDARHTAAREDAARHPADIDFRDRLAVEERRADQVRQELSIEAIIRARTRSAFFSRCKDFTPPPMTNEDDLLALPKRMQREQLK